MGRGNAEQGGGHVQKRGREYGLHKPEHSQPDAGADYIKREVDQSRPPGVFVGPHGGEHGGDTGADILPHDNGDRRAVGYLPCDSQRL